MYIKISKMSQLVTLRNINPFLKKRKLPKEVLNNIGKILKGGRCRKKDYIALFLKPVENDYVDILDALQLYPTKTEFVENSLYSIEIKGKKKLIWSCYEIKVASEGRTIYVVYPMRRKDLFGETDY